VQDHARAFDSFAFVVPGDMRRSRASPGVNLNPNKRCKLRLCLLRGRPPHADAPTV